MSFEHEDKFDGGYTADFLAFKHGITLDEARGLILHHGSSRKELDAAAQRLKRGNGSPRDA